MKGRWIAAIVVSLILAALLSWQQQRLALVDACHAAGGWWDGNRSRCRQVPPSIIIERNLKRSGAAIWSHAVAPRGRRHDEVKHACHSFRKSMLCGRHLVVATMIPGVDT